MNRLARHDAGCLHLDAAAGHILERALAVDRVAERVDDAAKQAPADGGINNRGCPADNVAFLDGAVIAKDHDTDIVAFEVQGHALDATLELDHLAGLHLVEAVDARDAVTNGQDAPDLGHFGIAAEIGDLFLQDC